MNTKPPNESKRVKQQTSPEEERAAAEAAPHVNGSGSKNSKNTNGAAPPESRAIELPAFWLHELGDLSETPPKRRWFMSDLRSGKKLLRMGKCSVLSADGGVGKSFFGLQAAVCVALGLPLFDVFQPDAAGYVALLMGEDDADECMDRLHRICNAMRLGREQRDVVAKRVLLFPLAGKQIHMVGVDQYKNPYWTETRATIIAQLTEKAKQGGFEWALVGFDPLARFAGGNAESDNQTATFFVEALESIAIDVPGGPAVLCSHHTSKVGLRNGKSDTRGVTGIRNAFRAEFVMERVESGGLRGVLLDNRKNNYAPHACPLWLVVMSDEPMDNGTYLQTGGVLRQASDDESETLATASGSARGDPEARRTERDTKREAAKVTKAQARRAAVLECVPLEPAHFTTALVEAAMERAGLARRNTGTAGELRELCELGVATELPGSTRQVRRWCRPASQGVGS